MFAKKRITGIAAMLAAALLLSAGVGAAAQEAPQDEEIGRVIVGTEPQVAVGYDEDSKVVDVSGLNEEGQEIAQEHGDELEGKSVSVAVGELVKLICNESGLEASVGGEKGIVVRIELGSKLPSDDFEEEVTDGAEAAVKEQGSDLKIISISLGDYSLELSGKGFIKPDKAGEIALAQSGQEGDAQPSRKSYQLSDGVYNMMFLADGKVIQASVDALSGQVMAYAESVFANITGGGNTQPSTDGQTPAEPAATAEEPAIANKAAAPATYGTTGGKSYGDGWEDWGESIGAGWESWGESFGKLWEDWGESTGNGWEDWGESTGDSWEDWGESTGNGWEDWGESTGNGWEDWGESTGNNWESWGESVGNLFDHYFDF